MTEKGKYRVCGALAGTVNGLFGGGGGIPLAFVLPLGEALPYLVGGLAGGWIGGRLFKDVPNTWLKRIFALFLLYGAVRYLL